MADQQTPHDGAYGFLNDKKAAELFRIHRVAPRLCRHCSAPMRLTSRGAFLCRGKEGKNSCDLSGGKMPPFKPPPADVNA